MCFFRKEKVSHLGCEWCFIFKWSQEWLHSCLILDCFLTCTYRKMRPVSFFCPEWVWIFKSALLVKQIPLLYSTHTGEEAVTQLLSRVQLFASLFPRVCPGSCLLELVMLFNHLILCHPLLLCLQSFPFMDHCLVMVKGLA